MSIFLINNYVVFEYNNEFRKVEKKNYHVTFRMPQSSLLMYVLKTGP